MDQSDHSASQQRVYQKMDHKTELAPDGNGRGNKFRFRRVADRLSVIQVCTLYIIYFFYEIRITDTCLSVRSMQQSLCIKQDCSTVKMTTTKK